ncbi:hypothetical protein FKP32DRAFT_1577713 [Trametes sanguinea]|nr:hypothetical protein FKP32DRAFT_1577713 [Trametes sanguinea]
MRGQKRRLAVEPENAPKTKRPALVSGSNVNEDEDSLESILALIQAQEESEALARKLQQEWNAPGPSTSPASAPKAAGASRRTTTPDGVIEISDDEQQEDDETIARRLAKQWELEDAVPETVPVPLTNLPATKGKAKSQSATRPTTTELPISPLEQYRDLFTQSKRCPCGADIPSPRGYVVFSSQEAPVDLLRLLHAPCKSCNTNHCRGCMSSTACPPSCKGSGQATACSVERCCADVRAIALFEVLGAFDRQYLEERATSDERVRETAAKSRYAQNGSVGPGGTGYGCGNGLFGLDEGHGRRRGRGRGRARVHDIPQDSASDSRFEEVIVRAIKTITDYLPSPYSDNAQMYDMLPHPSIGSLLLASQLPDLLGTLLRNDSVTDWIARSDVYHAMLALLRRMADCELTLEVLIGARWEMAKSCGLEEWMWGDGDIVWERNTETGQPVPAPPLYVHFKKLTKQCETFLNGASHMLESAADGEDAETLVKATSLCGDIIAAKDDIERAMTIMGKDPTTILEMANQSASITHAKGKAKDPAIEMEQRYATECERLAFKHVALSRPSAKGIGLDYPEYYYANELSRTANATRNPKDRLHLVKELAVMATSLPPGVWVRVDEVRNDAMKIMIAGPERTPYAGGLFEFDCFIPLEYPNKPPLMYLRTTGGGRVRFNPNLYSNGKVCLSLLGTWEGRPEEMWQPRKSTLLQVLVSIQSMILIDHPWFNEPGRGQTKPDLPESVAYNKDIAKETVRWAVVDWLKDERENGLWADVIASHFLTRHDTIRKCILDWAAKSPDIRRYRAGTGNRPYAPMGVIGVANLLPYSPMEEELYEDANEYGAWQGSYTSGHRVGHPPSNPHGENDLLDEFDKGIERVTAWKLSGL